MKIAKILFLAGILIASAVTISAVVGEPAPAPVAGANGNGQETLVAGRNVNMVSGTRLPDGDPWLQRQNEPSIAVSTRNPLHLLAGSNDYRTVDMPDPNKLPGIPPQVAARDAWGSLYKSLDGGQSWITQLLPGFPQDITTPGLNSPIRGFDAVCDPYVRAGANGMFFYSGIAIMRAGGAGAVFVSRFIDNNNLERIEKERIPGSEWQWVVKDDPIKYIDTRIIDLGNPGQFIDMASVAVDVPRAGNSGSQSIFGQLIPNANVFVAYTVFLGVSVNDNVRCRLMLAKSVDNGKTWGKPIKLSEGWHIIQRPTIAIDPGDPTGNTVYVTFRRFAFGTTPGGIGIVKSVNGGLSFTKPIEVASLLYPFDQGMTENRFRTNSYPTMAVDHFRNVHLAWAERRDPETGFPDATGQARIVLASSPDGLTWGAPQIVEGTHPDYVPAFGGPSYLDGHQIWPCLAYSGGKLMLTWCDQRGTVAKTKTADCITEFIEDIPNSYRHTLDVRAAEWPLGTQLWFSISQQVSRYLYYLLDPPDENPAGDYAVKQGEHNPINLPLFELGTKPFHGDYMDLASSPNILPPPIANGSWAFNISPLEPTNFVATWTDNRDVRPGSFFYLSPNDMWESWMSFKPPDSPQAMGWEPTDPNSTTPCTYSGNRNQNVYSASLTKGIIVGSPGNTKQLNIDGGTPGGRRTFVVFIKNLTAFTRYFNLTFDDNVTMPNAYFEQAGIKDELSVSVGGHSSVSLTVYVDSYSGLNGFAPVKVDVRESFTSSFDTDGPLVGYVLLNPDPNNLFVADPWEDENNEMENGVEKHQPKVGNPKIWKYDLGNENDPHAGIVNPRVQNPRVQNSGQVNPRVQNPRVQNPRVQNNSVKNNNIVNQEVGNPRVQNPRVQNAALTDMTWEVTNDGNTTSAFTFDIIADTIGDLNLYFDNGTLYGQVLVYKVHSTPAPEDVGCLLMVEHHDELLVNVTNPRVQNPRVQNVTPTAATYSSTANGNADIGLSDVTFHLAPGDTAYVTLRVYDPVLTDGIDFEPQVVAGEVEAEAVNTYETEPRFDPQIDVPWDTPLPMIGASPFPMTFNGTGNQSLFLYLAGLPSGDSLPFEAASEAEWLSIGSTAGYLSGTPSPLSVTVSTTDLTAGSYAGFITIIVPQAANNPLRVPVYLTTQGIGSEMEVYYGSGGSTAIADGETYTFNPIMPGSDSEETFVISNEGNADLFLGGKPIIRIVGADADQFSVQQNPASPIDPENQTTFTIRFTPTSLGLKTATISIMNNDSNENPYDITLQGTAVYTPMLVAYYPFNGNANDESGNGNDGTPFGSPTYATDRFGNSNGAIDLDGLDDYIELPNESSFDLTEWTMVMTLKVQDYTKTESVISKGNTSWGNYTLDIVQQDAPSSVNIGKFGFVVDPVGSGTNYSHLVTKDPVPIDQYFQVAVTYNPTELNTYFNGENEWTVSGFPLPELNDDPVSIGSQRWLGHYFKGQIDEIRIYNYVLSPTEIAALYSIDQGLAAYYPFNGNANDESGNGNDGTPFGSPTYATDRFGNSNGAIDLDGLDDYIELPNESSFDLTEWTMVMTLKVQDYTKTESVISKGNTSWGNYTLDIVQQDAPSSVNIGKFGFVVDPVGSGTNYSHLVTRDPVPIDQYFQVAVTYNPTELNTYFNGENEWTVSGFPLPELNDDLVSIGSQRWLGHYFKGQIDDIRIYSRALTPVEIQVLYFLR